MVIILSITCKNCGEKISEDARCCLKCGMLNPYNEKTIKEKENLNELSKYYDKVDKKQKKSIVFKLSFIIDLLCLFLLTLFLSFYIDNFFISFIVSFIICFYRLVVLKMLLYKCNLLWQGVYIPVYGFLLIFTLGFVKNINTYIIGLWILTLGTFYILSLLKANSKIPNPNLITTALIILIFMLAFFYKIYIKICTGLCYRFKKSHKFKVLLIVFFPILILKLAFGKEKGEMNLEEEQM